MLMTLVIVPPLTTFASLIKLTMNLSYSYTKVYFSSLAFVRLFFLILMFLLVGGFFPSVIFPLGLPLFTVLTSRGITILISTCFSPTCFSLLIKTSR